MTTTILRPWQYAAVESKDPIIFLAGPIQGARDWQAEAIDKLVVNPSPVTIASPRRLSDYKEKISRQQLFDQWDWEHYHMMRAQGSGVVMFWLAAEHEHLCERAYAQTSRFELGWQFGYLLALAMHQMPEPFNLVIGIEEGFSNARYIRHTFGSWLPTVPILDTLDQTCEEVLSKYNKIKA